MSPAGPARGRPVGLRRRALGLIAAAAFGCIPVPAAACALELILAVDVSGSIDGREWRLQSGGMAAAFEDPAVAEAIEAMPGGLLVTYTQWSGSSRQRQVSGWHRLSNGAEARGFAAEIRQADRAWRNFSTAIGEALNHARAVSDAAPERCRRRVIDVSGDGVSNEGAHPRGISRRLAARGYRINALVIRGASPDPVAHFREAVIGGPGAFVEVAAGFEDYARAFRRKLLREIEAAPLVSSASPGRR